MTPYLLHIHDWLRWVVLAAAVVSAGAGAITWMNRRPASVLDRRLSTIFVGLLDLQWLAGVVLLILMWGDPDGRTRLFHGGVMTAAVLAAHLVRLRSRSATPQAMPPHLVVGALFPLLIIALGLRLWYA